MPITVLGLGPGDPDLLTAGALRRLSAAATVWLRTARHPVCSSLPEGPVYRSFDDLYDTLPTFEEVYSGIVERLLSAEQANGDVLYAVPGDPLVAEATVRRLVENARAGGPAVHIVSGVSFLEPVCRVAGVDPLAAGLQIVDALEPAVDPSRPALFAQIHGRQIASDLKLTLLELYPPQHEVLLINAAGVDGEEQVLRLPLAELDREPLHGHLSTLYAPPLEVVANRRTFGGLQAIAHRLYAPGGCPWDREQTHASLKHHLLEESYEVLQALDNEEPAELCEELGDLLLQVALHTEIADEAGEFGYGDIFESITSKLIRRHPHVFGDATAGSAAEVVASWQRIKEDEKAAGAAAGASDAERSLLAGVPTAMPSLAYAQAVQDRAAAVGFDWPSSDQVIDKLLEEVEELRRAQTPAERLDEFGDIVFVLANLARWLKIDAEDAGRHAGSKFFRRFSGVEALARQDGKRLSEMTLAEMDLLWDEVKAGEAAAAQAGGLASAAGGAATE